VRERYNDNDNIYPPLNYLLQYCNAYRYHLYSIDMDEDEVFEPHTKWGINWEFENKTPNSIFPAGTRGRYTMWLPAVGVFVRRYNEGLINCPYTIEEYDKNEFIQEYLSEFKLDKEQFWYMLLFIYDLSKTSSVDSVVYAQQPYYQVKNFIAEMKNNADKPRRLVLHTGDKEIALEREKTIKWIEETLELRMDEMRANREMMSVFVVPADLPTNPKTFHFVCFVRFFKEFLLHQLKIKRRAKRGNLSRKEMELVILLIYYTKISTSEKLVAKDDVTNKLHLNIDYLRGIMKEYSGIKIGNSLCYGDLDL